ncbi:UDP-N-acetylmuramoyl-L-alanine--D-glutamate ligase [Candidatus Falkowbacteria bacterium]|nr:UDP-N-acetylmuramoyl-L-alanine--D-glutamate ligase [Candidatus Falkowbacteria bacterium]
MLDFKNKKVLILGLGILGKGVGDVIFFAKNGAKVLVTDLKTKKQLASSLKKLAKYKNVKYVLGQHRKQDILNADLIIRNPDVPLNSPFLQLAFKKNIPVEMDDSLFAKYCPCTLIGVTGTRGKTTTTILVGKLAKLTGRKVFVAGNIKGTATLPLIDKVKPNDIVVLELSSWQLQGFKWDKISPHISVFTNIYPDHLNRYESMEQYIDDKKNIFKFQKPTDFIILNKKNKETRAAAKECAAEPIWFEKSQVPKTWKLKMLGAHNLENVAAALQVGKILGLTMSQMKKTICDFPGVEHRLEHVATIKGVNFINDTTSTTPIAGQVALKTVKKPIILIAGGATKKLDLSDFAVAIAKTVKAVALLDGTATAELEKKIICAAGSTLILGKFNNLRPAVNACVAVSRKGDTILLSPGCASFGIFKNEFDRGEQFKKIVKRLFYANKIRH